MRIRRGPATVTGEAAAGGATRRPLGARGPGKARSGRPGSQETSSDRPSRQPSWKGVAHSMKLSITAVMVAGAPLARRGTGARRAATVDRARRGATQHARRSARATTDARPSTTARRSVHRHERRRRARRAPAATGTAQEFDSAILGATSTTIQGETRDFSADVDRLGSTATSSRRGAAAPSCSGGRRRPVARRAAADADVAPADRSLAARSSTAVPARAAGDAMPSVTVVGTRHGRPPARRVARRAVAGATVTGGRAPTRPTDADGKAVRPARAAARSACARRRPARARRRPSRAAAARRPAHAGRSPRRGAGSRGPGRARCSASATSRSLKRGPRELRGASPTRPAIKAVKLRLTSALGGKCWYFSGSTERFRGTKCGARRRTSRSAIAPTGPTCCPRGSAKGRYVLDAIAIDGAGNRTPLARGTTRVVFSVR